MKDYKREINEIDPHAQVLVINDLDVESPPMRMNYIKAYPASECVTVAALE